jgi:hypothetical protein
VKHRTLRKNSTRLFVGVYPGGIVYADKAVTRELAEIDLAVDEEEDGAEVLWAHRPVVVREKRRLDGVLMDLQQLERRVLNRLASYGIDPERDYRG